MRPTILAAFAFLSTAACFGPGTGGTWLGLFPAPKFLDGSVANDCYTPPDRSFTVALPHEVASSEYPWTTVQERQDEWATAVQFGPAAFDQGLYLAGVHRRPPGAPLVNPAQLPADGLPPWVGGLKGPEWAVAHLVRGEHVMLAGQPALFQLLEKPLGDGWMLFVADYLFAPDDDRIGEVRGVFPTMPHAVDAVREQLRSRTHEVFEPFAASLQLPAKQAATAPGR